MIFSQQSLTAQGIFDCNPNHDENPNCLTDLLGYYTESVTFNGCNPPCTVEFTYRQRVTFCIPPAGPIFFDIIITSAVPQDCAECYEQNKAQFQQTLFQLVFDKPEFKSRFGDYLTEETRCFPNNNIQTLGYCYRLEGNPPQEVRCSDITCCTRGTQICMRKDDKGNVVIESYSFDPNSYIYPQCNPNNCPEQACNVEPSLCDNVPCNFGAFTSSSSQWINYPLPNCPDCKIKINYQYRTADCPEDGQFNDYYLENIEYHQDCAACFLSMDYTQIISFAFRWMLQYGEHFPPSQQENCKNTYRILNSACFTEIYEVNFNGLKPCSEEPNCCWSLYEICLNPPSITRIDQSNNVYIECDDIVTRPCVFICDIQP